MKLNISCKEIHVWSASSEASKSQLEFLLPLLSPDEVTRATKFYFQKDFERFITARGILRVILSYYVDIEPGNIRLNYNSYGKPAVLADSNQLRINFSLSHSERLILYAITCERKIGVDLEYVRVNVDYLKTAKYFLSKREYMEFCSLSAEQWPESLLNCWTRKEAYIKAVGKGFSICSNSFDVSFAPHQVARLIKAHEQESEPCKWTIVNLYPGKNYVGALVAETGDWDLTYYRWYGLEQPEEYQSCK